MFLFQHFYLTDAMPKDRRQQRTYPRMSDWSMVALSQHPFVGAQFFRRRRRRRRIFVVVVVAAQRCHVSAERDEFRAATTRRRRTPSRKKILSGVFPRSFPSDLRSRTPFSHFHAAAVTAFRIFSIFADRLYAFPYFARVPSRRVTFAFLSPVVECVATSRSTFACLFEVVINILLPCWTTIKGGLRVLAS